MPVNYQFTSVDTNEPTPLNWIDGEICKMLGEKIDEKRFHPIFDLIVSIGMGLVWTGQKITKERIDEYIEKDKSSNCPYDWDKLELLARKFLLNDYTFSAWR